MGAEEEPAMTALKEEPGHDGAEGQAGRDSVEERVTQQEPKLQDLKNHRGSQEGSLSW